MQTLEAPNRRSVVRAWLRPDILFGTEQACGLLFKIRLVVFNRPVVACQWFTEVEFAGARQ
jgi:hypothetical protein